MKNSNGETTSLTGIITMPLSWEYVAAFFDGEGSISVKPREHSIDVVLRFSQLDQRVLNDIATFLRAKGVTGVGVYAQCANRRHTIHALAVSSNAGVLSALNMMLPYLRVKYDQAKATIDCLQDKITGDEFAGIMNEEVRAGRRAGKIYVVNQPYMRSEGIRTVWGESMAHARDVYRELASSAAGHLRFGLGGTERNNLRGKETRKKILRLLCDGPMPTYTISVEIGREVRHVRRLLNVLQERGYLTKERRALDKRYISSITEKGRRYLQEEEVTEKDARVQTTT